VDQQLASLLVTFWAEGDLDSAKVLADRLQELPAADIAQALVEFRTAVKVAPMVAEAASIGLEGVRAAIKAFASAVGRLSEQGENFPPWAPETGMENQTMKRRCDGCNRTFGKKLRFGPLLHDPTWQKLAHEQDELCGDCLLQRAAERGVNLTFLDLYPCAFNLFGSPSWFEYFGGDDLIKALDAFAEAARNFVTVGQRSQADKQETTP